MRQEYKLGDSTNPNVTNTQTPNTFQASLWWQPSVIEIINLTSNPLFVNERRLLPSATSYDIPVAPGATLRLPTDSTEFAGFLPLAPALTDLTAIIKIIFENDGSA